MRGLLGLVGLLFVVVLVGLLVRQPLVTSPTSEARDASASAAARPALSRRQIQERFQLVLEKALEAPGD